MECFGEDLTQHKAFAAPMKCMKTESYICNYRPIEQEE